MSDGAFRQDLREFDVELRKLAWPATQRTPYSGPRTGLSSTRADAWRQLTGFRFSQPRRSASNATQQPAETNSATPARGARVPI